MLSICRQMTQIGWGWTRSKPKTEASDRIIALDVDRAGMSCVEQLNTAIHHAENLETLLQAIQQRPR